MGSHGISGRGYVYTWLGLLALTGASLALSAASLGVFAPIVALSIAALKALVVAAIFMHLLRGPFVLQMIAVVSVLFVALICLGILADVAFR
jgi:cytochrome c oxidase subunit 4